MAGLVVVTPANVVGRGLLPELRIPAVLNAWVSLDLGLFCGLEFLQLDWVPMAATKGHAWALGQVCLVPLMGLVFALAFLPFCLPACAGIDPLGDAFLFTGMGLDAFGMAWDIQGAWFRAEPGREKPSRL